MEDKKVYVELLLNEESVKTFNKYARLEGEDFLAMGYDSEKGMKGLTPSAQAYLTEMINDFLYDYHS